VKSGADEYRRRAQQCLEMAGTFRDRDARDLLDFGLHAAKFKVRLHICRQIANGARWAGLAVVVACALFAAISGSSVATVVGIGSIILPAIVQNGYWRRNVGPWIGRNPPYPYRSLCYPPTNQWEEAMKANYKMAVALASVILGALAMMLSVIATALAQDTVRVRGTIERIDGSTYVVKACDGAELKVTLADSPPRPDGSQT
jgi:hypothetical protein